MIVLPWFVRFGLDCTISITPLIYFHYHPTMLFFEYFQNRRRLIRRKKLDDFANVSSEPTLSLQESRAVFKELGIEE